jgi:phosphoribosyl-ATP pyrophosphohydrolase
VFPTQPPTARLQPAKDDNEFRYFVLDKVIEEAKEVHEAGVWVLSLGVGLAPEKERRAKLVAELADLQDLVHLVADSFGIDMSEVIADQILKNRVRGGFERRLIWSPER